jgi:hypothetical protein
MLMNLNILEHNCQQLQDIAQKEFNIVADIEDDPGRAEMKLNILEEINVRTNSIKDISRDMKVLLGILT